MVRKRNKTKAKLQRRHSIKRAFERHGVSLVSADVDDMRKQIASSSGATFVMSISNTKSLHHVVVNGMVLPVVYQKPHSIVTVFPYPYCAYGSIRL